MTSYQFSNLDDHRQEEITHCSLLYGEGWWCQLKEVRHLGQFAFDYKGEAEGLPDFTAMAEHCPGLKMKIGSSSPDFALFPKDQFEYKATTELAESHFFIREEDSLQVDTIYNRGIMNLYLTDKSAVSHDGAGQYHILSPLLSFLSNDGDRVYAFLSFPNLIIIAYKGGRLMYSTIKTISNEEEGLYYIMKAYEVSELDPQTNPIYLGGRCLKDSPWYKLMYRFISDVQWVRTPGLQKDAHIFHDVFLLSRYF